MRNHKDLLNSEQRDRYNAILFDDDKVYNYSTEQRENSSLMGVKWNGILKKISNPASPCDMAYVLDIRKAALKRIIEKFGIYGIFHYFKQQWPHFFKGDSCKIICKRLREKGACEEEQKEKCESMLIAILRKLSFPRIDYFHAFSSNGFSNYEPEQDTKKINFVVVSTGAIEKKVNNCFFHEDKEMVLKLNYSKKPICALCRSRSVMAMEDNFGVQGEELEERIIVYLKKQAQSEKKQS